MVKVIVVLVLLAGCVGTVLGFGTGEIGCSGDCTACHKVSKLEAQDAVRKLDPTLTVETVSPAPVPGLYQVVMTKDKIRGIAYLDFSKRYLIQGQVIDTGNKVDITSKSMLEMLESQVVDTSRIKLDSALLLGNPHGKKHLYVFTDPECPYCARLHEELLKLVQKQPDLTIYLMLLPLDIHPEAAWKTNAIIAASRKDMKKALAMLDENYHKRPFARVSTPEDYVQEMKKLGQELGIGSTPTIVYANGRIGLGFKTLDEIVAGVEKNVATR